MGDLMGSSQFRIGDLLVIPARLVVVRNGEEIKFEPRWMQVLVMLAEHVGETLSSERLLIDVWENTFYGDSPVSKTISYIRKSIGDDSRKPRYIETVSKAGYRLIEPVSLPEDYRRVPSERWTKGSPYVGLSAFDADHASVFCGRSRIVEQLLRAMRVQIDNQRRFVLIVGASGCGKTSLLRAGAIPLLTKPDGFDGLRAVSVTTCDLAANGSDPLIPLTTVLAKWTIDGRPVFPPQTPDQLKALLTETPEMIEGFISEAFRLHLKNDLDGQPYAHLLLTVDHAEALVATADIDTNARDTFARVLQALCACPRILVTMITRGDFYLKLIEALPVLAEYKAGDGHLDVMAPRYGEIGEIIRSPAWKADLNFETDPETRTRLDDALRDAALSQPDALPLLQHTLQTLYERRNDQRQLTFVAYNDIGGLEGAVAHRAEQVFAALPAREQASLDSVLTKLIVIQFDSDAVSGRRAFTDDLSEDAKALVNAFIAARLFVSDHRDGHPTVGVVHEALLRRWPRAVEWTQENRRLLMAKERLHRAAMRWVDDGRQADHLLNPGRPLAEGQEAAKRFPEDTIQFEWELLDASSRNYRIKRRIRNSAIVALTVFAISTGTMAIYAWQSRNEAIMQRQETLALIDYMLVELTGEIRPLGKLELLGSMSSKALTALKRRPVGQMEAHELVQYARVLGLTGERLLKSGKMSEAKKNLDMAFLAASKAVKLSNRSTDALNELGQISYWLGDYHYRLNQYKKTLDHWNSYYKISEELVQKDSENPTWIRELGYAVNNLGTINFDLGNYRESLSYFTESARLKKKQLPNLDDNPKLNMDYIDTLSWISRCKANIGELRAASEEYSNQISKIRSVIKNNQEADSWKISLANSLARSADLEWMTGNHKKAEGRIIESLEYLEILTNKQPDNADWLRDLAFVHMKNSDISYSLRNKEEAITHIKEAASIIAPLTTNRSHNTEWSRLDAMIQIRVAKIDHESSEPGKRIRASIKTLEDLHRQHPDDYSGLVTLAESLISSGDFHLTSGDDRSAVKDWNRACSLVASHSANSKEPRLVATYVSCSERLSKRNISVSEKSSWLARIGFFRAQAFRMNKNPSPLSNQRKPDR